MKRLTPYLPYAVIAAVVIVLDQVSKYLAVASLTRLFAPGPGGDLGLGEKLTRFLWTKHPARTGAIQVLENFWHWQYAENDGAAFSLFAGSLGWMRTPFLLIVSLAAMVFIVGYFRKTAPDQRFLRVALALVFGGAIGNFLDRVRLGYVIDFIVWHWYEHAWPTFNVADSAISVGVTFLLLEMLYSGQASKRAVGQQGH